jgi:hypothetical protein
MGEAWVEMQTADGRPIEGFALSDAVSIDRNGTKQEVWWKDGADLSRLSGKPVRMRIKMRRADLYSFGFTEETA